MHHCVHLEAVSEALTPAMDENYAINNDLLVLRLFLGCGNCSVYGTGHMGCLACLQALGDGITIFT